MKFYRQLGRTRNDEECEAGFVGRLDLFINPSSLVSASPFSPFDIMTARLSLLARGKGSPTKTFSAARSPDPAIVSLINETLGPGMNSARRSVFPTLLSPQN